MKKQIFYGLTTSNNDSIFLTICDNKKDIQEYIRRYLIVNHYSHFEAWCKNRELNLESPDVWDAYIAACIDESEILTFQVKKMIYDIPSLASILRMFSGCIPLGASFEKPVERMYFADKMAKMNATSQPASNIQGETSKCQ